MTSSAKSRFVYVTFIRTDAESLWAALTSEAMQREYWFGMHLATDWQPGAAWQLMFEDGRIADGGEVVEMEAPRRLVLTWRHVLRPELAEEGQARCAFDIEPVDGAVKLTVTHEIDREGSRLIEAVSGGWPRILSNLKSLLETGDVVVAHKAA